MISHSEWRQNHRFCRHQRVVVSVLKGVLQVMTESATGAPKVLFVCSTNQGKSQIAAACFAHHAGDVAEIDSAGTTTNSSHVVNEAASEATASVIGTGFAPTAAPRKLTAADLTDNDYVVLVGSNAQLPADCAPQGKVIRWELAPSAGDDPLADQVAQINELTKKLAAEITSQQG